MIYFLLFIYVIISVTSIKIHDRESSRQINSIQKTVPSCLDFVSESFSFLEYYVVAFTFLVACSPKDQRIKKCISYYYYWKLCV